MQFFLATAFYDPAAPIHNPDHAFALGVGLRVGVYGPGILDLGQNFSVDFPSIVNVPSIPGWVPCES